MKRRSFLLGLGVTALAAPAVVRAESLMKIWVPKREIVSCGSLLNQNGLEIAWTTAEDFTAWQPMLLESVVQYSIPVEAYKKFAQTAGLELFK